MVGCMSDKEAPLESDFLIRFEPLIHSFRKNQLNSAEVFDPSYEKVMSRFALCDDRMIEMENPAQLRPISDA